MNWEQIWKQAIVKVSLMNERIGNRSPHVAKDGRYDDMPHDWWTSYLQLSRNICAREMEKLSAAGSLPRTSLPGGTTRLDGLSGHGTQT